MIENLTSIRASLGDHPSRLSSHFEPGDPRRLEPLEPASGEISDDAAAAHGFIDRHQLELHLQRSRVAREAIEGGAPDAPDGNGRVLHIRCGTDIRDTLAQAGFQGDFLAFYDPYVHGPVPHTDDLDEFIGVRADYISGGLHPDRDQVLSDLNGQYADLNRVRDYDAAYLWFEHDSYDQLILAKLLDFLSEEQHRPASLKLISVNRYPGVRIFNGIGQLPAEALRVLWHDFKEVSVEQLDLGRRAWAAIRAERPDALYRLVAGGTAALPTMAIALRRHLQQLPSVENGLNLSENLTLEILRDKGGMNAARLFGWYTNHYEPLTFMGDTGYWQLLNGLAEADQPAISLVRNGDKPNQWQVELSETGKRLLEKQADWIELNGIDRWLGGMHLSDREDAWIRFDEDYHSSL